MNWLVAHVFTNVIRIFNARRRITFTSNIHDSQQNNNASKVIAHKNGYKYYLSQWEWMKFSTKLTLRCAYLNTSSFLFHFRWKWESNETFKKQWIGDVRMRTYVCVCVLMSLYVCVRCTARVIKQRRTGGIFDAF